MTSKLGHIILWIIIVMITIGLITSLILPTGVLSELSGWVKGFLMICLMAFIALEFFGFSEDSGILRKIFKRKD